MDTPQVYWTEIFSRTREKYENTVVSLVITYLAPSVWWLRVEDVHKRRKRLLNRIVNYWLQSAVGSQHLERRY